MKKRIFSILLSIILIFSIICCASVPGSAVFVVDDALIASIGISICASIILSVGISAVVGSDNVYVEAVEAMGAIVWEQFTHDMDIATIMSLLVIENGKAFFRVDGSLYDRLKTFILNFNWQSVRLSHQVDFITSFDKGDPSLYTYKADSSTDYRGYDYTIGNTEVLWTKTQGLTIWFKGDNTVWRFPYCLTSTASSNKVVCISPLIDPSEGFVVPAKGYNYNQNNSPTFQQASNISQVNTLRFDNFSGSTITYAPNNALTGFSFSSNGYTGKISNNNGVVLFTGSDSNGAYYQKSIFTLSSNNWDFNDYLRACVSTGCILKNQTSTSSPGSIPFGTTYSDDLLSTPLDTQRYAPAIPGNRIGDDQTALIPVPGNFVDPSSGIPLTQRTVKNRVKRGQDVAFVPDVGQLQDKTPSDLGVQVVNNVDVQDTVVSPTLSTTYIGENSTTYAIIPQVPINTPIPEDLDSPLYSSPYPDVINPGNEQITVTANNDVFPTAGVTPSERPSVQVTDNAEIASSAVEGISEIASEAVSDLAQPIGPGDVERNANRMKISSQLLHKFPFCIPYDFYNAVAQFAAPGEVIKFDIPFDIERLNIHYTFHIDLTQFETVAKISRWFFSVSWVVVLIFLTRKVIWK